MCTGITHVYRCRECNAVVYILRDAARGHTCRQARHNARRGICRTGIDWSHYDRVAEDICLFCEIFVGGDILGLTAETCDEGGEPWPEDAEDELSSEMSSLFETLHVEGRDTPLSDEDEEDNVEERDGERKERDEKGNDGENDDDEDPEEGGAKVH